MNPYNIDFIDGKLKITLKEEYKMSNKQNDTWTENLRDQSIEKAHYLQKVLEFRTFTPEQLESIAVNLKAIDGIINS